MQCLVATSTARDDGGVLETCEVWAMRRNRDKVLPAAILILAWVLAGVGLARETSPAADAGRAQSPLQRQRGGRSASGVYKASIHPRWFADGTGFWYRNDLPDGKREYIVVDAVQGVRRLAFDHQRLADALRKAGVEDVQPDRLSLDALKFELAEDILRFRAGGQSWRCDLKNYELRRVDGTAPDAEDGLPPLPPQDVPRASERTGPDSELTFVSPT